MPDAPARATLTFAALDGLAFAAARGRLDGAIPNHVASGLGPLMEMHQFARRGALLPDPVNAAWLRLDGSAGLFNAVSSGTEQWISEQEGRLGLFRCRPADNTENARWRSFRVAAHKAALASGFATQTVSRLMGAMGEIRDNVLEHSQAVDTGMVTFSSSPEAFEFAVSDCGIGILASLKSNSEYTHLRDEGEALRCALSDGESRYGKAAERGTGFSQLFKSLASLNATLRFRSGDHALTISGKSPTLMNAHVAKKTHASGFLTCVECRVH